ncbi:MULTISPECIES: FtsL-like putative cell division protein [Prevotella]|uniref:FtsL-like putative cell division protein n=1 Tax=Prevotella TaxID=838 RepID=UPI001F0053E9|nr:FtsL-like putative cell division protein [Prevotella brunnea]
MKDKNIGKTPATTEQGFEGNAVEKMPDAEMDAALRLSLDTDVQEGIKLEINEKTEAEDETSNSRQGGKLHEAEDAKEKVKKEAEEKERERIEQERETLKAAIAEQAREDEQPASANFTLKKILGGDILYAHLLRNNIWLIILMVAFIIVYISNRYSVQKDLIEIDRLTLELEDAKYRALSSSSQLTERTRESHVLEILKTNKDSVLKMSSRPPFIINVPED